MSAAGSKGWFSVWGSKVIEMIWNGTPVRMGQRIFLTVNGNMRPWLVVGWLRGFKTVLFQQSDAIGD